jgi:hypothetical protein
MNYVDTQLYIPHKVECDFDLTDKNGKNDNEIKKTVDYLTNLVELNYITLTENSLNLTKSGYDYFMRKCNMEQQEFRYDSLAPMEIQQMIFKTFFENKPQMNTVEKFIKANLTI